MDPNETLRIIRATTKQMRVEDDAPATSDLVRPALIQHGRDLAEHVEALDEWLSKGGFPPEGWKSQHMMLLRTAYDLLGDGQGNEWDANPEYTRAITELVAEILGVDKDSVLDLVKATA